MPLDGGAGSAGAGATRGRPVSAPRPPYGAYAGIMSTFLGGVAVTGILAAKLRRSPPEQTAPADDEKPVQTGDLRQAVGELVTCSRCVGTWIAAGIAGVDVLAPRFGRMLSWSLAVGGANDWLQA